MNERDRDNSGRFKPEVSEKDILNAVHEHEPAGTGEVGDAVGLARQNADYRLRRLEDAEEVRSKKVGRSLVWMLTHDEQSL
jgi:predicted transcriptional regulator